VGVGVGVGMALALPQLGSRGGRASAGSARTLPAAQLAPAKLYSGLLHNTTPHRNTPHPVIVFIVQWNLTNPGLNITMFAVAGRFPLMLSCTPWLTLSVG